MSSGLLLDGINKLAPKSASAALRSLIPARRTIYIDFPGNLRPQIISISCNSTKYWEARSWDKLRLPKPFGKIYIDFSDPMDVKDDVKKIDSADDLTLYLNNHLEKLDEKIVCN